MGCITPDQVEDLMHDMNHQKIVAVIPDESENGDDKLKRLLLKNTKDAFTTLD